MAALKPLTGSDSGIIIASDVTLRLANTLIGHSRKGCVERRWNKEMGEWSTYFVYRSDPSPASTEIMIELRQQYMLLEFQKKTFTSIKDLEQHILRQNSEHPHPGKKVVHHPEEEWIPRLRKTVEPFYHPPPSKIDNAPKRVKIELTDAQNTPVDGQRRLTVRPATATPVISPIAQPAKLALKSKSEDDDPLAPWLTKRPKMIVHNDSAFDSTLPSSLPALEPFSQA